MTFYIGVGALLLSAFLGFRANAHRKRVIAARERIEAAGGDTEIAPVWQAMGTGILPFYLIYGMFGSLLLLGGWLLTNLRDMLSVIDVLGLLVLIITYTAWMIVRTYYTTLGLDLKAKA